jgi:hypothetical protein
MEDHLKTCSKAKQARRKFKQQQQQQLPEIASPRHSGQTLRHRERQRAGPGSNRPDQEFQHSQPQALEGGRIPCSICGRGFARDRIAIHQKICRKNQVKTKGRGVFDAGKQRREGTDMESSGGFGGRKRGTKPRKQLRRQSGKRAALKSNTGQGGSGGSGNKWKEQSQALRQAMKYAKMATKIEKQGGDLSLLPPPPPQEEPSDFIPCPHCGRTFNQQAGERHIKACGRTIHKPKRLLRNAGPRRGGLTLADPRRRGGGGGGGGSSSSSSSRSGFGSGRVPIVQRKTKKSNGVGGGGMGGSGSRFGGRGGGMGKLEGGFSMSNECSADNPLVYPSARQSKARFR